MLFRQRTLEARRLAQILLQRGNLRLEVLLASEFLVTQPSSRAVRQKGQGRAGIKSQDWLGAR
jgi:hypothetical protein